MFHPDSVNLKSLDPEIAEIIICEHRRQEDGIELIASENYTSQAVMEACGSLLTNKYAEGYPGKRYYGGCVEVDRAEQIGIDRAKELFGANFANIQPHSGSQANMAAYFALVKPGEKILGMELSEGGHLTHGSSVNFSGKLFNVVAYGLNPETEMIDYDQLEAIAKKEQPKLIVAGASAYPRKIDFARFRAVADSVGAYLLVDMAHIAGLVAAGLHDNPVPHAHVVTSTTHKTLRGPRGGLILTNDEALAKKFNSNIFPGIQGGPLMHIIAAKAVSFKEAMLPEYRTYQQQVVKNCARLASQLEQGGFGLVSGGSDNHLILAKTDSFNLSGKKAEAALERAHITCNKNMVPQDTRSPFITSGIRMGTPAITTRGFREEQMDILANWIIKVLKDPESESNLEQIKSEVQELCRQYPVYEN
ncbi:MAG: serine hydroxymethyltransferase [Bdellovibrionales bacterium]|jgi:glycine hydroxymethyltransferase|nr:serine hydroxymethyltransferase [Bdellovibrionales bacterium]MBT3526456.1 serine hydroxymethyltransferase [Bdellovibrionales bacterium]